MAIHKRIISMNANKGCFMPKNMIDQKMFRISWTANQVIASLFFLKPLIQTRYKAIPINTYNKVQTGPKIQLGGLKNGLFNDAYQPGIEGDVNKDPISAAARQIATE